MNQPWVLIVDDDEQVCKFLEATVSSWSMRTKSLTNPLLVADALKRNFYHVILLDVFMPQMHGMVLAAAIHQVCPDTKVVIMKDYTDTETAIKALSIGASDFLDKPIAVNLLYYTIKRALDSQRIELEHRKVLEEFSKRSKELIETIAALSVLMKNVAAGKKEIKNEKTTAPSSLSFREMQIAMMIKNDTTNAEIATRLHISLETVRTHRRNIRKKLGIMGTKTRLNAYLWVAEGEALMA
jgi:DNA-binding NarL/FixJ family response regulator